MATLLVTGGAGFIGSCFVRDWLRHESSPVLVLDKLTYAGDRSSLDEVEASGKMQFCQGDIADRELVARLLSDHAVDAVLNFAAESHVDRSISAPAPFVMTNVVGTYQLLEAAREYWSGLPPDQRQRFRFLHVSTDEVYGELGSEGCFTETSPYAPNSPYSASKAAADHFVRAYGRTFGLPVLITNSSNNFGPFQHPEKLIPRMILNALEGQPLPVYGDGLNVRDWMFVEDHCRALRDVLRRAPPGSVYNIGAGCERTNLQVVEAICGLVDRLNPDLPHRPTRSLIQFVSDRPGHDRRYAVDASKIRRELGWVPQHDLDTALEATVRWYMNEREWVERMRRTA